MFPFLVSMFFNKNLKQVFLVTLLIIFCYIMVMIFMPHNYTHQFFYINPLFRIVDFIIGIFLFLFYDRVIKHIKINKNASSFIELISIILIVLFVFALKTYPNIVLYAIFYWIPLSILILSFVYSEQILERGFFSKLFSNKVFLYLGNISFSIFIIHQLVIRTLDYMSAYFKIETHNYFGLIIAFILTMIASVFCYHYIEKPASKKLNEILLK